MKISDHKYSQPSAHSRVNELVLNWHAVTSCNYSCIHCFSLWDSPSITRELFHNEKVSLQLLSELNNFFSPNNPANPLNSHLKWDELRLSLCGGEVLVFPKQSAKIANGAKRLGFKVSLITNASLLSFDGIAPLLEDLCMLGISIDSINADTCRLIGRVDRSGRVLSVDYLVKMIEMARSVNPKIKIKINTVVNKLNYKEDMTEFIKYVKPDKWKVLKVLSINNDMISITENEFFIYVNRHKHIISTMSVENEHNMTESYLMIDPYGRFFQNKADIKTGDTYFYSQPILKCGVETAFKQINFDVEKFAARYPYPVEVAI